MLAVCHVDVGDDVHDASVGFFGQALIFAAVAGFHVEDGDVESFCSDDAEAGVGVAEDEDCVGLGGCEELVGAVDDVAACGAKVIAYGIHIYFGLCEFQILEEDAVEVVVVVLPRMGEDYVEIAAALVDNGGKADDLGAGADDDAEFEFAVFLPVNVSIIKLRLLFHKNNFRQKFPLIIHKFYHKLFVLNIVFPINI